MEWKCELCPLINKQFFFGVFFNTIIYYIDLFMGVGDVFLFTLVWYLSFDFTILGQSFYFDMRTLSFLPHVVVLP